MCKNFMVIRHSIKELLAKSMVTRPMKCIVVKSNMEPIKHDLRNCSEAVNWSRGGCPREHQVRMRWDSDLSENM